MEQLAYLGKGERFPLKPDISGGVELISDTELIKQSIRDILNTPRGTRFYVEDFGCNIRLLSFEPQDAILKSLGSYYIAEALFKWEKRIRVTDVDCQFLSESSCNFIVSYRILASNETDAFVYPFYKELRT